MKNRELKRSWGDRNLKEEPSGKTCEKLTRICAKRIWMLQKNFSFNKLLLWRHLHWFKTTTGKGGFECDESKASIGKQEKSIIKSLLVGELKGLEYSCQMSYVPPYNPPQEKGVLNVLSRKHQYENIKSLLVGELTGLEYSCQMSYVPPYNPPHPPASFNAHTTQKHFKAKWFNSF